MIGANQKTDRKKYDLDKLVQSSFGYSDEQLLEQFETAQATIMESQIPPELEENYKRIEVEIKKQRIRPHFEHNKNKKGYCEREIDFLKPVFKTAIAFAMAGSLLILSGISSGTGKSNSLNADSRTINICGRISYEYAEDMAHCKGDFEKEQQTLILQPAVK